MRRNSCALLILLLFTGCTPGKIKKLEITRLGNIEIRSVTSKTLSLDVEIFLHNPYLSDALVKKISFDISMTGGVFGKGYVQEPFEIDSDATKSLIIPVVVDCDRVSEKDYLALFTGTIPYHFQGTLDLEKPVHAEKVELDAKGTVKRPEPILLELQHKTVLSVISLQDSSVRELLNLIRKGRIELEVRNPFSFAIDANQVDYEIGLGKFPMARGNASTPVTLHPGLNTLSVSATPEPLGAATGALQGLLDRRVPALNFKARINLNQANRNLTIQARYFP